ncbi:ABC transporter permease [Oleidesulfovibrio sp.]|uniref:ABC transporter permease n=1 Tax=Oleidesulfovibrio sp. TaxID=2909707 RepID=UPI003A846D21
MAAPGSLVILLFFIIPLGVVISEAFIGSEPTFATLFNDSVFWRGLGGTLVVGLSAPTLSLIVGFAVAWHMSALSERVRTTLMFWISLPLTFSGLIVAYGFILAFGRAGFVTLGLAQVGVEPTTISGFLYSPEGLAFAYSYYLIPRVVLTLLPVLVNFDRSQLKAAESLGASPLRALKDVLIPQVLPSAINAFCLVSAVAVGAYGTALALVGTQVNILPLTLYSRISDTGSDFPSAAALSVVLLALCTIILAMGELYSAKRSQSEAHH